MSKQRAGLRLAELMQAEQRDFPLDEIYRAVCRPPFQEVLSPLQLHSLCSRAIGEARRVLRPRGYRIVLGELRGSYRAVKVKRS